MSYRMRLLFVKRAKRLANPKMRAVNLDVGKDQWGRFARCVTYKGKSGKGIDILSHMHQNLNVKYAVLIVIK